MEKDIARVIKAGGPFVTIIAVCICLTVFMNGCNDRLEKRMLTEKQIKLKQIELQILKEKKGV